MVERICDAKAGSAWDVWHAAGFAYAEAGGTIEQPALDVAANAFAVERGFPGSTTRRAFKKGARQFVRNSN